jgi:hypothetical protein
MSIGFCDKPMEGPIFTLTPSSMSEILIGMISFTKSFVPDGMRR